MRDRRASAAVGAALLLWLAGAAAGQKRAKEPFPAGAARWELRGVARYTGPKVPRRRRLRMVGDPYCEGLDRKDAYVETLIVGPDRGLQNVFVYVKRGLEKWSFPRPQAPVVLDQQGCVFRPHLFGIQVGQTLVVKNSDKTTHNVHFVGRRNREWNRMQTQGQELRVRFRRPEILGRIKCDIHSWMGAYVGILAHPFFAVTDAHGRFTLPKLPPGEYVVAAWHEKLGRLTRRVRLEAQKAPPELVFAFAPRSSPVR